MTNTNTNTNTNTGTMSKVDKEKEKPSPSPSPKSSAPIEPAVRVIDIGINLTNKAFKKDWKNVIQRAVNAGVDRIILTGTSIKVSKESLKLAHEWYDETGIPNLYVTIGIHPHDAKSWNEKTTLQEMKKLLLNDPLAIAIGECGLDYNRNFSTKKEQIHAFRNQVQLAYDLQQDNNYPIFIHEREAHTELIRILDQLRKENENKQEPKIVIHCFTGTREEAMEYISRGYYIGLTGMICKTERGALLRDEILSNNNTIPLERIMIETDAPWMGFKTRMPENNPNVVGDGRKTKPKRRMMTSSEPIDCIDIAKKLSETINISFEEVCETTTNNAMEFFNIPV